MQYTTLFDSPSDVFSLITPNDSEFHRKLAHSNPRLIGSSPQSIARCSRERRDLNTCHLFPTLQPDLRPHLSDIHICFRHVPGHVHQEISVRKYYNQAGTQLRSRTPARTARRVRNRWRNNAVRTRGSLEEGRSGGYPRQRRAFAVRH